MIYWFRNTSDWLGYGRHNVISIFQYWRWHTLLKTNITWYSHVSFITDPGDFSDYGFWTRPSAQVISVCSFGTFKDMEVKHKSVSRTKRYLFIIIAIVCLAIRGVIFLIRQYKRYAVLFKVLTGKTNTR